MSDLLAQYSGYLDKKNTHLDKALTDLGLSHFSTKIIPTPLSHGYRNRGKFKIYSREERCTVKGTDPRHGEIPMEKALWIFPAWGRELICRLSDILLDSYDSRPVDGFEVQMAHGQRQAHVALSVKKSHQWNYSDLAKELINHVDFLEGIAIPSKGENYGSEYLYHRLNDNEFRAHYTAFFQSNLLLLPQFIEDIKDQLDPIGYDRLLDLYCGVGLMSLSVGEKENPILGVDRHRQAIECARENAKQRGFLRADFFCSQVEAYVHADVIGSGDLIILDPPRTGCPESVIHSVVKAKPKNICLVSCYLDTHVRDLKLWQNKGYSIQSLLAYDMFPFTDFLETLTILERL